MEKPEIFKVGDILVLTIDIGGDKFELTEMDNDLCYGVLLNLRTMRLERWNGWLIRENFTHYQKKKNPYLVWFWVTVLLLCLSFWFLVGRFLWSLKH